MAAQRRDYHFEIFCLTVCDCQVNGISHSSDSQTNQNLGPSVKAAAGPSASVESAAGYSLDNLALEPLVADVNAAHDKPLHRISAATQPVTDGNASDTTIARRTEPKIADHVAKSMSAASYEPSAAKEKPTAGSEPVVMRHATAGNSKTADVGAGSAPTTNTSVPTASLRTSSVPTSSATTSSAPAKSVPMELSRPSVQDTLSRASCRNAVLVDNDVAVAPGNPVRFRSVVV